MRRAEAEHRRFHRVRRPERQNENSTDDAMRQICHCRVSVCESGRLDVTGDVAEAMEEAASDVI